MEQLTENTSREELLIFSRDVLWLNGNVEYFPVNLNVTLALGNEFVKTVITVIRKGFGIRNLMIAVDLEKCLPL